MSPRGRPVSMPPSLSASGSISVTPRSSHPTESSHSERARSASGLMCTREPLPSGCLRQLSSHGARTNRCRHVPSGSTCGRRLRAYATGSIAVPSPPHIPLACRAPPERMWTDGRRLWPPERRTRVHGPTRHDSANPPRRPPRDGTAHAHIRPLKGRPWGPSSTPTSRTTWSGSSGPTAPPAAGPPISPRSSAAPRGPPP